MPIMKVLGEFWEQTVNYGLNRAVPPYGNIFSVKCYACVRECMGTV